MKKLIGTVSVAMMLGCALALANTDDVSNTSNSHGTTTTDTMNTDQQQPGTAADVNDANPNVMTDQTAPDSNKMDSSTTTTTTKSTKSAMNKSCVDNNGNTLHKGQTGYRACIKMHKQEQMGGIADQNADQNSDVDTTK